MCTAVFAELRRRARRKNNSWWASTTTCRITSLRCRSRRSPLRPGDVVRAVVFRAGRGRNRGRQQELHQDHRRGHGQLRAGLFRLRLEEVWRHDNFAPAFRAQADSVQLPDLARQFRRLPSVLFPGANRCFEASRAGRDVSAEQPLRAAKMSGTICPIPCSARSSQKRAALLCDRRVSSGAGKRHGRPHQHGDADLLFCAERSAAARPGDRRRSNMPSKRPTENAARQSCRRTSPPSTKRWPICLK